MPMHAVNDGTDFQLNYEVIENVLPEDVLFLHGNCASNRWWYPAEEIFKRHAKGKKYQGAMILAEFRGCGKSSAPKNPEEVNMDTFANDFISLVKSLHRGSLHLVGHSTGGLIAAMMMAKAPDLFKKALLLDPVGATGIKFDDSMIEAFDRMKKDRELVANVMGSTIHNNDVTSDFFRSIVVPDAFHAVQSVGHLVLKALDNLDVREELSAVKQEVLILHGQNDKLLPMQDSKVLARLMAKAEFRSVADCGHCLNVENPAQFVSITEDFLF